MAPAATLISRYNAAYYCTITAFNPATEVDGRPAVTLSFTVRSDMSLGPFQRPTHSTLRAEQGGALELLREEILEETGMKIVGRLSFARPEGPAGPLVFVYGELGYSEARLPQGANCAE